MSDPVIQFEVSDGIGVLTINRPKALNALNSEVLQALAMQLTSIPAEVKVLILTGSGEKSFVAGADIAEMSDLSANEARAFARMGHDTFRVLEQLPMPTIAAVNGFALGGGTELALSCDFILACETAKFGQPEVGLGLIPGFGGTQRLARRIGAGWARQLVYSGAVIKAEKAKEIGLVNDIYPCENFLEAVKKVAAEIAAKAPVAVSLSKRAINMGLEMSLDQALAYEQDLFGLSFTTEDVREGTKAFLEKRKPDFKGK